ncbi:MAG: hypothetical protein Q7S11_00385 [bacterium]|nr:hypothetical protein [bacterium]
MNFDDYRKYIFVFIITSVIFFTAFAISNYSDKKRIQNIQSIEDKIALDLLSSETQFNLLKELSCKAIDNSVLSQELNSIAEKLTYAEENLGVTNPEVIRLKKYYSVLQVKDYLLMKQVDQKCKQKLIFILYFYSNKGDCADCKKEGYVLTDLREEYPELRVYSFDYNLDFPIIKTLQAVFKLKNTLPAIIIGLPATTGTAQAGDETHYGFKSREEIENLMPILVKLKAAREKAQNTATSTATTTQKKK